eukprot:9161191-Pyramimonas_sp.AAC.1
MIIHKSKQEKKRGGDSERGKDQVKPVMGDGWESLRVIKGNQERGAGTHAVVHARGPCCCIELDHIAAEVATRHEAPLNR